MYEYQIETLPDGRKVISSVYDSLDEMADAATRHKDDSNIFGSYLDGRDSNSLSLTFDETLSDCRNGWDKHLTETLELAESAVKTAEEMREIESFHATWDVSGCEVDVARYLAGEPENMIDYPLTATPRQGRIVILCASIAYSWAVSAESIVKRGQVITAFALALARMGIACELWVDWSVRPGLTGTGKGAVKNARIRTMIKGTNDTLDPAKVLFAYAHPGNLRKMHFALQNGLPASLQKTLGPNRGYPAKPIEDMPDGTIYLGEVRTGADAPDAHTELRDMLKQAGFITE